MKTERAWVALGGGIGCDLMGRIAVVAKTFFKVLKGADVFVMCRKLHRSP